MRPNVRSATGIVLMLGIIPVFAGLLACMPVPIGDPEKSRIDPDVTGIWVLESEGSVDGLYSFQPFDKRSWLITGVAFEKGPNFEGDLPDFDTADDVFAALDTIGAGLDGLSASKAVLYKAWLSKIGGVTFMTWEIFTPADWGEGYQADFWYVFRVEKEGKDRIELYMIGDDPDVFEDRKEPVEGLRAHEYPSSVRRDWERALKKVAKDFDNEDLYSPEPIVLRRVPEEMLDEAIELFGHVLPSE